MEPAQGRLPFEGKVLPACLDERQFLTGGYLLNRRNGLHCCARRKFSDVNYISAITGCRGKEV